MTIQEALSNIQIALKAPKSQYNSFGKYNYRNCEDILEAVKPLCREQKTTLTLSDSIVFIDGRHYVEATATLTDWTSGSAIAVKALAREEEDKKGMDGSQVTGASSSYARKYALNGLFNIDDTKDSDTTNTGGNEKRAGKTETAQSKSLATPAKPERVIKKPTENEKVTDLPDIRQYSQNEIIDAYNLKTPKDKRLGDLKPNELRIIACNEKYTDELRFAALLVAADKLRQDEFVPLEECPF